LFGLLRKERTI